MGPLELRQMLCSESPDAVLSMARGGVRCVFGPRPGLPAPRYLESAGQNGEADRLAAAREL